jgi:hypothetical protein
MIAMHELGHVFLSPKLEQKDYLIKKLNNRNIDFHLYNLFEDIRIEYLMGKLYKYYFSWGDNKDLPEPTNNNPFNLLLHIKETQGIVLNDKLHNSDYLEAGNYYRRIIEIADKAYAHTIYTIDEMIDLLVEYNNHYKNNENNQDNNTASEREENSFKKNETDCFNGMSIEKKINTSPELLESIIAECCESLNEASSNSAIKKGMPQILEPKGNIDTTAGDIFGIKKETIVSEFYKKHSSSLAEISNNLFEFKKDMIASRLSKKGHRLDIKEAVRNVLRGNFNGNNFITSSRIRKKSSNPKITVIVDYSYSMKGEPEVLSKLCLLLFKILSYKNIVDKNNITCIGSKIEKGKSLYDTRNLHSLSDELIISAESNGEGEGIGNAIINNYNILKDSDYCFLLSDGNYVLDDMDEVKKISKYKPIVQNITAIYFGKTMNPNDAISLLSKNFSKCLVSNNNIENLFLSLVLVLQLDIDNKHYTHPKNLSDIIKDKYNVYSLL